MSWDEKDLPPFFENGKHKEILEAFGLGKPLAEKQIQNLNEALLKEMKLYSENPSLEPTSQTLYRFLEKKLFSLLENKEEEGDLFKCLAKIIEIFLAEHIERDYQLLFKLRGGQKLTSADSEKLFLHCSSCAWIKIFDTFNKIDNGSDILAILKNDSLLNVQLQKNLIFYLLDSLSNIMEKKNVAKSLEEQESVLDENFVEVLSLMLPYGADLFPLFYKQLLTLQTRVVARIIELYKEIDLFQELFNVLKEVAKQHKDFLTINFLEEFTNILCSFTIKNEDGSKSFIPSLKELLLKSIKTWSKKEFGSAFEARRDLLNEIIAHTFVFKKPGWQLMKTSTGEYNEDIESSFFPLKALLLSKKSGDVDVPSKDISEGYFQRVVLSMLSSPKRYDEILTNISQSVVDNSYSLSDQFKDTVSKFIDHLDIWDAKGAPILNLLEQLADQQFAKITPKFLFHHSESFGQFFKDLDKDAKTAKAKKLLNVLSYIPEQERVEQGEAILDQLLSVKNFDAVSAVVEQAAPYDDDHTFIKFWEMTYKVTQLCPNVDAHLLQKAVWSSKPYQKAFDELKYKTISSDQLKAILSTSSPKKIAYLFLDVKRVARNLLSEDNQENFQLSDLGTKAPTKATLKALNSIKNHPIFSEKLPLASLRKVFISKKPNEIVKIWLDSLKLAKKLVSDLGDDQEKELLALIVKSTYPRRLKKALNHLLNNSEKVEELTFDHLKKILESEWPAKGVNTYLAQTETPDVFVQELLKKGMAFPVSLLSDHLRKKINDNQRISREEQATYSRYIAALQKSSLFFFLDEKVEDNERKNGEDREGWFEGKIIEECHRAFVAFKNINMNDKETNANFFKEIAYFFKLLLVNKLPIKFDTAFLNQLAQSEIKTSFENFKSKFNQENQDEKSEDGLDSNTHLAAKKFTEILLVSKEIRSTAQIMPSTIRNVLNNRNPQLFLNVLNEYRVQKYSIPADRLESILIIGSLLKTNFPVEINSAFQIILNIRRHEKLLKTLQFLAKYPGLNINLEQFRQLSKEKDLEKLNKELETLKRSTQKGENPGFLTDGMLQSLFDSWSQSREQLATRVARVNRNFSMVKKLFRKVVDKNSNPSLDQKAVLFKIITDPQPIALEQRLKRLKGIRDRESVTFLSEDISLLGRGKAPLSLQSRQLITRACDQKNGQLNLFGRSFLAKVAKVFGDAFLNVSIWINSKMRHPKLAAKDFKKDLDDILYSDDDREIEMDTLSVVSR